MRSLRDKIGRALAVGLIAASASAAQFDSAARATNELGADLVRQIGEKKNLCLSPYSISCALAMALDGAEGETRTEMRRVLHLPEKVEIDGSFQNLQKSLEQAAAKNGVGLEVADRLYPQSGYAFRPEFLARLKEFFGAEPEALDFEKGNVAATKRINAWVAERTHRRIRELIPSPLEPATRLVLVNALYFKASWAKEFSKGETKPEPFHLAQGAPVELPTMQLTASFAYEKSKDFTAIALPYAGGELQFLILLPNERNGLAALEKKLDANLLARCAQLPAAELELHLPTFKFEPPTIALSNELKALGMKQAFDEPRGSANFERMAARKADEYLAISEVLHKTFIAVDEAGTEAAAATALPVTVYSSAVREQAEPIVLKVDRPFFYAIQHQPSGVCLLLGHATDPRATTR